MDITAVLLVLALLFLVAAGLALWRAWQLREIEVLSRDQKYLKSTSLGLSGRPDRLIRLRNGAVIPEEKKSATRLYPSLEVQLGVYLLLVEEAYGIRPPFGTLILADNSRHKIRNTGSLRRRTLKACRPAPASTRRSEHSRHGSDPTPGQCRSCGFRESCSQALA